jgi:hypothetical protein
MKAHLNLTDESVIIPDKKELDNIGCEAHRECAKKAADECITLVKDTYKNLPVNPDEKKRVFLVYVGSTPTTKGYTGK